MLPDHIFTKLKKSLASTELALALFGVVCLAAIPGTFTESRVIYSNPLFVSLLCLLALNLLFCSWYRWKSLAKSTLVMHGGVLLTLAGCVLTSFGYVATVNVHEGSMVDTVYRWDKQQDCPLGMKLAIKRINREYYPVPVKVGVLRGAEKHALKILHTGESFDLDGYRVKVEAANYDKRDFKVSMNVSRQGKEIGVTNSDGFTSLPASFPYAFKLVAFQDPVIKRGWVDLQLSDNDKVLTEGTAEVNGPFFWKGLYFYNTLADYDEQGNPYAGIQIVRDPGRYYVFSGFAVMSLGAVLAFVRRFFPSGRAGSVSA